MEKLIELRALRAKVAEDLRYARCEEYWSRMEPVIDQLKVSLEGIRNAPKDLRPTCERILKTYQRQEDDPKEIGKLIDDLRSISLSVLDALDSKAAAIDGLITTIGTVTPSYFRWGSVQTMVAIDTGAASRLIGAHLGLDGMVGELDKLEECFNAAENKALERQAAGQGEPVAKQRRTVSTVLSPDDEPKHRSSREFSVLSGVIK